MEAGKDRGKCAHDLNLDLRTAGLHYSCCCRTRLGEFLSIMTLKKCVAEVIGTFALVFAGTGAIIINDVSGGAVSHVGIALTFGLVVLAMIYAVGDISGAHLNPAV